MAKTKKHYRAVWISDIHLGTYGCQSKLLNEFLKTFSCDILYLVGDIIDGWKMSRSSIKFPQDHINIIRQFLSFSKKGTKIIYIVGNHDEFIRLYIDGETHEFGNITLCNEHIHKCLNGATILIQHGDMYDGVTRYHKWVSHLGDMSYSALIRLNVVFNYIRQQFGMGYWSLSQFLKHKVKQAVDFIASFEDSVVKEGSRRGVDAVLCGHIHHPEIRVYDNGIVYFNTGDWMETCSALVETDKGTIELLVWNGSDMEKIQQIDLD